ncbi:MAG: hypothetical protein GY679_04440 [Mycoplasma sp.]|nr:hypothetical protein [Mycoplasma sp.]
MRAEDLKYKVGFHWVNYANVWLIAEYNKIGKWYACGEEDEINTHIREVGEYVGCEGKTTTSERTLDINSCVALIKSIPADQAIQIMKSDITGQPPTVVIGGELVVAYVS